VDEFRHSEIRQQFSPCYIHGNEMILVAEDDDALRGLAKDELETLGYTVLVETSQISLRQNNPLVKMSKGQFRPTVSTRSIPQDVLMPPGKARPTT